LGSQRIRSRVFRCQRSAAWLLAPLLALCWLVVRRSTRGGSPRHRAIGVLIVEVVDSYTTKSAKSQMEQSTKITKHLPFHIVALPIVIGVIAALGWFILPNELEWMSLLVLVLLLVGWGAVQSIRASREDRVTSIWSGLIGAILVAGLGAGVFRGWDVSTSAREVHADITSQSSAAVSGILVSLYNYRMGREQFADLTSQYVEFEIAQASVQSEITIHLSDATLKCLWWYLVLTLRELYNSLAAYYMDLGVNRISSHIHEAKQHAISYGRIRNEGRCLSSPSRISNRRALSRGSEEDKTLCDITAEVDWDLLLNDDATQTSNMITAWNELRNAISYERFRLSNDIAQSSIVHDGRGCLPDTYYCFMPGWLPRLFTQKSEPPVHPCAEEALEQRAHRHLDLRSAMYRAASGMFCVASPQPEGIRS